MTWTQIAENYWVSPQIEQQQIATLKEEGFEVIVCNRPDGEAVDQVSSSDIKKAAEAAGLEFVYLPMQGANFTPEYLAKVQQLNKDGKKVMAYCRSGNRSSILFNASLV